MSGPKKKAGGVRPPARGGRGRRAEAAAVDELGLPKVAEGEQLVWRPVEYLGAVLALTELNVLFEKAFDAMTVDELEQVERSAFAITFAVLEEKHRREDA